MKTNKRFKTKMVNALVWAAIVLVGSFLLKSVEGNEQVINFLIIVVAVNVSLFLNGATICFVKQKNSKQSDNNLYNDKE